MRLVTYFLSALLVTNFYTHADQSDVAKDMKEKIKQLETSGNYVFVNLQLSENEKNALDKLKIGSTKEYNNYANLPSLKENLPNFFRKIGNDDEKVIQTVSELIIRLVKAVTTAARSETAWLAVRAFEPTSDYNKPRWHMDGYYYSPYAGFVYKFGVALKGRQTLFYPSSPEIREIFKVNEDNRDKLAELLDINKAVSAAPGYGAFFVAGDSKTAAIHSEPKIDTPRLFISILPGTIQQINEWGSKD